MVLSSVYKVKINIGENLGK